jgi:peptidoglycan hydrolase-like protein with peptidoglycan-binding domain
MASKALHEKARNETNAALIRVMGHSDLCVRQFLQTIGLCETSYGYGWTGDGVGSNNMGAIMRGRPPCGADAFGHGDRDELGNPISACFAIYPTREAGWDDLVRVLYLQKKPDRHPVLIAAQNCDVDGAVAAMKASGYFTLALSEYQKKARACASEIASALGEPNPAPKVGAGGSSAGGLPSPAVPRTISRGAKGESVRRWQAIVGVGIDGWFGSITELATIRWQADHGLKADGIVGPKTWTEAFHVPRKT